MKNKWIFVFEIVLLVLIVTGIASPANTIGLPTLSTPSTQQSFVQSPSDQEPPSLASPISPTTPNYILSPNAIECGVIPTDGCFITQSTTFTTGNYFFPSGISILADNIILNCNNAVLRGNATKIWISGTTRLQEIGIFVNGTNVTIRNCELNNYSEGITPMKSGVTITNNRFVDNFGGIMAFAPNTSVIWNNFSNSSYYALLISQNGTTIIQNNKVLSGGGFFLGSTNILYVQNNSFENGFPDLYSLYLNLRNGISTQIIIANNFMRNNSFDLRVFNDVSYDNGDYFNRSSLKIYNNTVIGKGIALNKVQNAEIINNSIINASPTNSISLSSSKYILIKNNYINSPFSEWGITAGIPYGWNNHHITIINNFITGAQEAAILLTGDNNNITGNTIISNGEVGIWLNNQNTNFTVSNNYLVNNSRAVLVDISSFGENIADDGNHNGVIYNNTAINSSICGFWLRQNSTNNVVEKNTAYKGYIGICLEYNPDGNTIIRNNLTSNSYSGLHFSSSLNNKVFLNNIYGNPRYQVDAPSAIELSYLGIGNYWGRTTPPCFVAGTDSNRIDVIDSNPFCGSLPNSSIIIPFNNFGWYFFGSNIIPINTTTSKILSPIAGSYEVIQSYIGGVNRQYKPTNPPFLNTLTNMYPWDGYWLKFTSSSLKELIIVGDKVTGCNPLTLGITPVNQHWIGYWVNQTQPTASALSSIAGNYELVRTYENGVWKTYNPALPQFSDLLEMKPGQAYLVKMINQDNLDYLCG